MKDNNGWRSTKESLPEKETYFLGFCYRGTWLYNGKYWGEQCVQVMYRHNMEHFSAAAGFDRFDVNDTLYWMPLPDMPIKEEP